MTDFEKLNKALNEFKNEVLKSIVPIVKKLNEALQKLNKIYKKNKKENRKY